MLIKLKDCTKEQTQGLLKLVNRHTARVYIQRQRIEGTDWHDDDKHDVDIECEDVEPNIRLTLDLYHTKKREEELTKLVQRYICHICNCEGTHYIYSSDARGDGLSKEDQKHLLALMGIIEEDV